MPHFEIIGFDADDTLWQTERLYLEAQARLRDMLSRYISHEGIEARLYETEMRNLDHFGYGIKAFALSMIETAIELTDGRVSAQDIQSIIENARGMMAAEIEVIGGAADAVAALAQSHTLMLITKGDLRDQETKIARSGLASHFQFVEIVSSKSSKTYQAILEKHKLAPARFLMVGNSLPSDILPVLELGGTAIYIPWEITWAHDAAEVPPASQAGFHQLANISQLPTLIEALERQTTER
jgi:putative hydrolase of the HAD superfamily